MIRPCRSLATPRPSVSTADKALAPVQSFARTALFTGGIDRAIQAAQERDNALLFRGGEAEGVNLWIETGIPVATAIIVIDYFFESCQAAVMHVGRGPSY